jgi:hypothetical protein
MITTLHLFDIFFPHLEKNNISLKPFTQLILVAADGTWRAVINWLDDEDAGIDGNSLVSKGPVANLRK